MFYGTGDMGISDPLSEKERFRPIKGETDGRNRTPTEKEAVFLQSFPEP